MSDYGRMSGRLASSYRQDDRRGADDRRRIRGVVDDPSKPMVQRDRLVQSGPRLGFASFLRLIPWLA